MTDATDRHCMNGRVVVDVQHSYILRPGTKYVFTVGSPFQIVPGTLSNREEWHKLRDVCPLIEVSGNYSITPKIESALIPINAVTADSAMNFKALMNKLPAEMVLEVAKYLDLDEGKPLSLAEWLVQLKKTTSHFFAITEGLGKLAQYHFSRENVLIMASYPYTDLASEPTHLQQLAIEFQELWNRHNDERDQSIDLPPFFHLVKDIRVFIRFDKAGLNLLRYLAEEGRLPLLQRIHIFIDCDYVRAGGFHNTSVGMPAVEAEVIELSDGWQEIAETVVDAGTVSFKLHDSGEARFATIGAGRRSLFRIALSFGACMYYPSEEDESFGDWTALLQMIKRTVKLENPTPGTETHAITTLADEELYLLGADALHWEILGSS